MSTALDTQPTTKAKSRKVTPLGKLLAAHNELLGAWIVSGFYGGLEVRNNDGGYSISFCGLKPADYETICIYINDRFFEVKKQRILDYLSGKIDYLRKAEEIHL